eukprot:EG_transcript_14836
MRARLLRGRPPAGLPVPAFPPRAWSPLPRRGPGLLSLRPLSLLAPLQRRTTAPTPHTTPTEGGQWLRRGAVLTVGSACLGWPALALAAAGSAPEVSALQQVSGVLAPAFTVGLFSSPLAVLRAVVQAQSTGPYAVLPYLTMQSNCALWAIYAARLGDTAILFPNCLGLLISTVTIGAFAYYSSPAQRPGVLARGLLSAGVPATFLLWCPPLDTLGLVASGFAVSMFASPLAQLGQVVQAGDSAALPFAQILMGALCTSAWTAYGWCIGNPFVLIPNGLGAVLSLIQLAIYWRYHRPTT